ncbi:putative cytochrome P450 12a5, mitochondrial [Dermacentor variabilis]|uniref:putative cytochrome P450 12a5, mitochondrial n=1 Tax=Dermacentor variabilis TaxID=34621 RepID=UPI003F5C94D1
MFQKITKCDSLTGASRHFSRSNVRYAVRNFPNVDRGSFPKPFGEVPKIPSLPVIGSSWAYAPPWGKYDRHDINKAAWEMYHQYGPVVAETLPGRRILVHLFSADDFRTLYQEEGRTPYRMGAQPFKWYHDTRPEYFSNPGIINAQNEQWQQIRAMAQPSTLRPRAVDSYAEGITEAARSVVEYVARQRDKDGYVANCEVVMNKWALESIMMASLGKKLGLLDGNVKWDSEAETIFYAVDRIFSGLDSLVTYFPYYRYFSTPMSRSFNGAGDTLVPLLFRMTQEAVAEAQTRRKSNQCSTILQHLLSNQEADLKDIFTFLHDVVISGANTTGTAATFALYYLATNPEVQAKAREEVLSSLCDQPPEGTRPSDPNALPYLKACIKETLRFHPIIPGVNLKLKRDVIMSGYRIPANVVLRTEWYVAGRLEENFSQATTFLPERWLQRSSEQEHHSGKAKPWTLHPFASLPFGTGPRTCIGKRIAEMELCTLLTQVLKRYRVESHHGAIGFSTQATGRADRPVTLQFTDLESAASSSA